MTKPLLVETPNIHTTEAFPLQKDIMPYVLDVLGVTTSRSSAIMGNPLAYTQPPLIVMLHVCCSLVITLTFWRWNYFFLILAHSVYKM